MPLRQRRILNYLVRKGRFRAQMAKSSPRRSVIHFSLIPSAINHRLCVVCV